MILDCPVSDTEVAADFRNENCRDERRGEILHHERVEDFRLEGVSLVLDFFDDGLGFDDPADKDAGDDRDYRHQEAARQEVEEIEELHFEELY